MDGEQILNEVRFLIDDMGYSRYNEINRSYRKIGRITRHNWLRNETEETFVFSDGVGKYWVDVSEARVLSNLWVKGNDSGKKFWHQMEEVSRKLFEERRAINISPDGTNRESRPAWYKIIQFVGQRYQIQVTPVPDETYDVRVESIRSLEEISRETTPSMPEDYHDLIANLAAGYILERNKDPKERARGKDLTRETIADAVNGLVHDAHANRTINITRPRRSVNEFI